MWNCIKTDCIGVELRVETIDWQCTAWTSFTVRHNLTINTEVRMQIKQIRSIVINCSFAGCILFLKKKLFQELMVPFSVFSYSLIPRLHFSQTWNFKPFTSVSQKLDHRTTLIMWLWRWGVISFLHDEDGKSWWWNHIYSWI